MDAIVSSPGNSDVADRSYPRYRDQQEHRRVRKVHSEQARAVWVRCCKPTDRGRTQDRESLWCSSYLCRHGHCQARGSTILGHLIFYASLYIFRLRIAYALNSSTPQTCWSHTVEDDMRILAKFEQRFATEGACRAYLAQLRWPTGFCCPQCTTSGSWTTTRCLLMCRRCGYQASVTAGTIFHRTRLPLQDWF